MPLPDIAEFIGTNVTQAGFKDAQRRLLNFVSVEVPTKSEIVAVVNEKADKEYVDRLAISASKNVTNFKKQAELLSFIPADIGFVGYALDTKKTWLWDLSNSSETPIWNDVGPSELELAKKYALNKSSQLVDNAMSSIDTRPFSIIDDNNNLGFGVNWDGSYEGAGAKQESTDSQSDIVWGVADDDGNVSTGAMSDGSTLVAGLKHEQSSVSGVVDEFGNITQVLKDGDLLQHTIYSHQIYVNDIKQRVISCFEEDGDIFIVDSGETKQITFDGLNKSPTSFGERVIFLSKKQRGIYKQYQYKNGVISRYYPKADFAKYVKVICSGQSLMLGNELVSINRDTIGYGFKIAGPTVIARHDANTLGDIEPLAEGNYQTISTGFAKQLAQANILVHGCARGGTTYANLKKGAQYAVFENIAKQNALISSKDKDAYTPAIIVVHGEADGNSSNANYDKNLREWLDDFNAEIRKTEGSASAVMLTCQTSSASGYKTLALRDQFTTPALQLKASNENPNIFLVGPKYQYEYKDYAHITAEATRHHGEMYAKVYKQVVDQGNDWKPLQPTGFNVSGNKIVIDFHVPTAPLQFDTTYIAGIENHGFNLTNADSNSITSVEITSPTQVTITCSENITNGSVISYAFYNGTAGVSGRLAGNRGALKDSDDSQDSFGYMPLNNWCVIFKYSVTI